MQNNAEEAAVNGTFGAAAAAEAVQVSSLHRKCNELALLPRTSFGAYRNATARRNYSTEKKQKESAEKLFAKIQTAVNHPDSCFFNKKQRKQLTSMCLQLSLLNEPQRHAQNTSTVPAAMAAAAQVDLKELQSILRTAGLDTKGFKISLLQRVKKAGLMHQLENPSVGESLLHSYKVMHGNIMKDAFAEKQHTVTEPAAEDAAKTAAEEATARLIAWNDDMTTERNLQEAATEEAAAKAGVNAAAEAAAAEEAAKAVAAETTANEEDASAEADAEKSAAQPDAETTEESTAEIALAHISNFYSSSTEGDTGRTWDVDAWQAMVESNCPELHLVATEGHVTWDTPVMPLMVANTLPTGYTPAVHQFLAEHFDYGRNLVVIDLLSVKKAHCGFMILLCNEKERARVAESERVADDGSTIRSNHIPTDLLLFDDIAGGMVHSPAEELDNYISEIVTKQWLFAGANIYDGSLLHEDYCKRLLGLDLECQWQQKKYDILPAGEVNIQSCTASSTLAQAVLAHTAGWTGPLDAFKAAGVLSLPDTTAADMDVEALDKPDVHYNMTEDRNKFMAYCMTMRAGGFFNGVEGTFNWPGDILDDDKTGHWAVDKLAWALFYPLLNKNVFSANAGLVGTVVGCWEKSDAAAATVAKASKAGKQPKRVKAVKDSDEHIRLNPEQIEKIVPLMLRNTQVGTSVQLSKLHGMDMERQIDMFTLSTEMLDSARAKGLKKFKSAEGQIAYTSVATANNCTTVLAVQPKEGKFTDASRDRTGTQDKDHRYKLGEVAHFSTMMMNDKMTRPLVVPMKVASRELDTYLHPISELPEAFGASLENVCYATAIVQPGYRAAQLDAAEDTRNLSPFVMLYRVYQADEFYKLMGLFRKELAQADGTFRVVTMIPHTFFVNWYALLPYITFVVH